MALVRPRPTPLVPASAATGRPESRSGAPAAWACGHIQKSAAFGERESLMRLPLSRPGMKIGLFGGSFNPPHQAHRDVSLLGLKRLGLDRIWWLVTPGNPLKDTRELPSLGQRIIAGRALARHPRIDVTGFEALSRTRYTFETVAWLVRRRPGVHFVWIMGADNLESFHLWRNWQRLAALVPMAIVDRDGTLRALASPAAQRLAGRRIPERAAKRLPFMRPPAWVFLHGVKSSLSSSSLRHRSG
jgi:nicotinate-nucleotide adenylyltransferase